MKKIKSKKQFRRFRIRKRIRKNLSGTSECPRLSLFRSNKQVYAQLIDDHEGKTLVSASSREKEIAEKETSKTEQAKLVGNLLAKKAKEAGIEEVVFDRSGYLYHGRVRSLAEAARKGGLKF
ncbi:MAG: 50S ribosomal protein L18 [Bacteroidales bacterium]|nr:50S ribosomal protein L18 [Bacteroidales bacterium]MCF8343342.1 50S ribosomal protein L18 [Bacteroidales bacterium]MCF8350201.1 50S ribosomal protein L18 [Bacteroidales bacterium]MCF8375030.1 50S ribosomal protein L18 [Bacteroidales bacterium]MCF8401671.1 50S ribosomal protein L18 [Bacteroidales bacterium]